jgi:hypothetical protein
VIFSEKTTLPNISTVCSLSWYLASGPLSHRRLE